MERNWAAMDPAVAFFPVELKPVFIEATGKAGDLFNSQA